MIEAAGKYGSVSGKGKAGAVLAHRPGPPGSPDKAAFNIVVRRAARLRPDDFLQWWAREVKSGGELHEYCRREKARTSERYRAVARATDGYKQNNKSEFRRVADVPARDYFRWLKEDPNFWDDDKNLKSLKRDTPDARIYL